MSLEKILGIENMIREERMNLWSQKYNFETQDMREDKEWMYVCAIQTDSKSHNPTSVIICYDSSADTNQEN